MSAAAAAAPAPSSAPASAPAPASTAGACDRGATAAARDGHRGAAFPYLVGGPTVGTARV